MKQYITEIQQYPLLSTRETVKLLEEYKQGNLQARTKIINSNLRLVVNIAKGYINQTTSFSFLDLVQEGNIGLMRSVETYNPQKGAFSTYATIWIHQSIRNGLNRKDKIIKRTYEFEMLAVKYKKLIIEYQKKYNENPSDRYIQEQLKITSETLNLLKKEEQYNTLSLDQKMDPTDSESDALLDCIQDQRDDYHYLLDHIDNIDFLNVIKSVLSENEYYILYCRVLSDPQKRLENLGKEFGVTGEAIRQKEVKIFEKVKKIMQRESNGYKRRVEQLRKKYGSFYYKLKPEPLTPKDIYIFLYLKDKFSNIEQRLFYLITIDRYRYTQKDLKEIMGISADEVKILYNHIRKIVQKELEKRSSFEDFKKRSIKEIGSKIYKIKLIEQEPKVDYRFLSSKYANLTLEQIKDLFEESYDTLTEQEKNILMRYYGEIPFINVSSEFVNRQINLLLLGYKDSAKTVGIKKLYTTFIQSKQYFSKEQIDFLEYYLFHLKSKEDFIKKYPASLYPKNHMFLIDRLEMIYYGIYRCLEMDFNDEKYLFVKEKYKEKLGQNRIQLLDLYYGINGDKKSIQEMADLYGKSYTEMKQLLCNVREYTINLYANRNQTLSIDKSLYEKYIVDSRVSFTNETRNLLRLFVLENKTYDEINKITNLPRITISNIITKGIQQIDFYRFQILSFDEYTKEVLDQFFKECKEEFTNIEKKVIEKKYIEGRTKKDIALEMNSCWNQVNKIITRFTELYFSFKIKDVSLEEEDILKEINRPIVESVLSLGEKEIVSYCFGFKNDYNKQGITLKPEEICLKQNITKAVYQNSYSSAIKKIKGRKIGFVKPELYYMDRKELIELLRDSHLPISKKERETLYHLFGLYGFEMKTVDEVSKLYRETSQNTKKRYMCSILKMLKYKNKEIEGIIDYQTDILPNLKYFPTALRPLIEDYYEGNIPYTDLALKYQLTKNQIISIFDRIKIQLHDMISNPQKPKFDFEFYEKNRNNKNIPFYGNVSLADQMFRLYFGLDTVKRYSIPEMIKEFEIPYPKTSIWEMISMYMLSICKLKDGIKKLGEFSNEDIQEYYTKNEKTMDASSKKAYRNYFQRMENEKQIHKRKSNLSEIILYDMLKENKKDVFDIKTSTKPEVLKILRKYNKRIPLPIKLYLMHTFKIMEKELMTGKEMNYFYKVINKLDQQLSMKEQKIYIKKKG